MQNAFLTAKKGLPLLVLPTALNITLHTKLGSKSVFNSYNNARCKQCRVSNAKTDETSLGNNYSTSLGFFKTYEELTSRISPNTPLAFDISFCLARMYFVPCIRPASHIIHFSSSSQIPFHIWNKLHEGNVRIERVARRDPSSSTFHTQKFFMAHNPWILGWMAKSICRTPDRTFPSDMSHNYDNTTGNSFWH